MKYSQCTKEHVIGRNAVRVIVPVKRGPTKPSFSLPSVSSVCDVQLFPRHMV